MLSEYQKEVNMPELESSQKETLQSETTETSAVNSPESFDMERELRFNEACIEESENIGRGLARLSAELQQFAKSRSEIVQPTSAVAEELRSSLSTMYHNLLLLQRSFEEIKDKEKA